TISGMAPQARLSIYKVCWSTDLVGGNSCFSTDSVAAIDMAVANGVDVLNYSITGSTNSFVDTVEVAFYRAAAAGVFVAASAGNSGPGASTVAHNSPWLTTVAASTHDRAYDASATLGNGTTYDGAGLGEAVASSPLVYAGDVKLPSAPLTNAQLCYANTLDPAKVAGRIVLCDRGTIARVDKSESVADAAAPG
ncbi:MAG: S8 family serine peptidase, partial [Actinomycetota bacterium]|nr:S8 family serine peptidase [Actinomycetota bacterium]